MLNARLDKLRHRRVLLLAQGSKTAAKHLVCGTPIKHKHTSLPRHLLVRSNSHRRWSSTFNVAFISDGLVGGPTRQKLLELHPGLLLVWQVHAHGTLYWWGPAVWTIGVQYFCLMTSRTVEMFCPPPFFRESLWSFSLSCFSAPGDSSASSSIASSDSQAWRKQSDIHLSFLSLHFLFICRTFKNILNDFKL